MQCAWRNCAKQQQQLLCVYVFGCVWLYVCVWSVFIKPADNLHFTPNCPYNCMFALQISCRLINYITHANIHTHWQTLQHINIYIKLLCEQFNQFYRWNVARVHGIMTADAKICRTTSSVCIKYGKWLNKVIYYRTYIHMQTSLAIYLQISETFFNKLNLP